jgi:anti-sigma B factor antagonist
MAEISVAHMNGRTLIRVVGEIDAASAPRLGEALESHDGPITVDCSRLEFIDAAGLGVFARASRDSGGVTLRNASPFLCKLVKITGLDAALRVDASLS